MSPTLLQIEFIRLGYGGETGGNQSLGVASCMLLLLEEYPRFVNTRCGRSSSDVHICKYTTCQHLNVVALFKGNNWMSERDQHNAVS